MTRRSTQVTGELQPDCLYTTEGLWAAAGLGPKQIRAACAARQLTPHKVGKRYYFRGSQIIDWITTASQGGSYPATDQSQT